MNGNLQYSALARILTLNNKIHDLENQMLLVEVPLCTGASAEYNLVPMTSRVSDIQEEIDQATRASLATCWLGNADDEEEYEL